MTFFDIKVAVFVIKFANCKKKCAKPKEVIHRMERVEFWKNLAGMGEISCLASAHQQMRIIRIRYNLCIQI